MSKPTHNFNPSACYLSSSIPDLKPCFSFTCLLVVLLVLEFLSIYTLITSRHDVPYCMPFVIIEYNSQISIIVFHLFHDAPAIYQLVNCAQCKFQSSELPFNTDVIYHSMYSIYFAMIVAKTLADILRHLMGQQFFSHSNLQFLIAELFFLWTITLLSCYYLPLVSDMILPEFLHWLKFPPLDVLYAVCARSLSIFPLCNNFYVFFIRNDKFFQLIHLFAQFRFDSFSSVIPIISGIIFFRTHISSQNPTNFQAFFLLESCLFLVF